jgi:hypothetical protein
MEIGKFSERDNNIYCKSCYNALFRPKGYGFGGGADTFKYITLFHFLSSSPCPPHPFIPLTAFEGGLEP